jgi:ABC-type branched-subunit amino acid transport system substrate-binding protein
VKLTIVRSLGLALLAAVIGCSQTGTPPPVAVECESRTGSARENCLCTRRLGEPAVKTVAGCAVLSSQDCPDHFEFSDREPVALIGVLGPLQGANVRTGQLRLDSARLAAAEINAGGGVPTDRGPVRIALVSCTDSLDPSRAVRHLVDDLDVVAVLSTGTSGSMIGVAESTLARRAFLIGASATSSAITNLPGSTVDGARLVWRTSPSDSGQSLALAALFVQVESEARTRLGSVKVATLTKGDAYGRGLRDGLLMTATMNGRPLTDPANAAFYQAFEYDPADEESLRVTAASLSAAQPDIVLTLGTSEVVTGVLKPYEQGAVRNTRYVAPDGVQRPELSELAAELPTLRARIRGVAPGTLTPQRTAFFERFRTAFATRQPQLVFGMAGAYDAVYLLSLAIARTGQDVRGIQVAKSFERVSSGVELEAGLPGLPGFFAAGRAGEIDAFGASGPLQFNGATGEPASDYGVWCLDNTQRFSDATGQVFRTETRQLEGVFNCPQ